MRSPNGSIHTRHTPPPLSFYNTFKKAEFFRDFSNYFKVTKKFFFKFCMGGLQQADTIMPHGNPITRLRQL
jgi:hypothetical protein